MKITRGGGGGGGFLGGGGGLRTRVADKAFNQYPLLSEDHALPGVCWFFIFSEIMANRSGTYMFLCARNILPTSHATFTSREIRKTHGESSNCFLYE